MGRSDYLYLVLKPRSLGSKYPFSEEDTGSPRFPEKSLEQHAVDYDPGGVSAISPVAMASLLPSGFLIPWACSTTLAFSRLNSFTLTDYGLLSPCLRFTHTVTCIDAKLGLTGG